MPRPKKSPRVRVQIVFEREQAKRLRAYGKASDQEISRIVRLAVAMHLDRCDLDAASGGRA
jgi:ACT domain-containing protein